MLYRHRTDVTVLLPMTLISVCTIFSCPRLGAGCSISAAISLSGGSSTSPADLRPWRKLPVLLCQSDELASWTPASASLLFTNHELGKSRFQAQSHPWVLDLAPMSQVSDRYQNKDGLQNRLCFCFHYEFMDFQDTEMLQRSVWRDIILEAWKSRAILW